MTPFMHSVQALLDGDSMTEPATIESRPISMPVGADAQMMVRSLAEQLVSEANAILREHGDVISLDDEVGPGELTFTLGYRDRAARVQTVLAGRHALATLVIDGQTSAPARQLSGEDELQALVLSLIGTTQTHSTIR
ncbi:hypothetical protein [uncultured Jatrophihabitans sp.]|uniref:hypothetical protein n=1 Tax=uncultured Jatrophihabitans sp. TaxID=1610747 RepID=UPI0035CAF12E